MPLINCEITLDLNWSENCVIMATNEVARATTFQQLIESLMFQL